MAKDDQWINDQARQINDKVQFCVKYQRPARVNYANWANFVKILQRHHSDHRHGHSCAWCLVSADRKEEKATEGYLDIKMRRYQDQQSLHLRNENWGVHASVRSLPINISSLPNKVSSVRALIENHRQRRERVLIKLKRVEIRAVMDCDNCAGSVALVSDIRATMAGLHCTDPIIYHQSQLGPGSANPRPGAGRGNTNFSSQLQAIVYKNVPSSKPICTNMKIK